MHQFRGHADQRDHSEARMSRTRVRRTVPSDRPPKYERAPKGVIVDEVEPRIRDLLEVWPDMPATVVAERIDWQRG